MTDDIEATNVSWARLTRGGLGLGLMESTLFLNGVYYLRISSSAFIPKLLPKAGSIFDAKYTGAERARQCTSRAVTAAWHTGGHAVLRGRTLCDKSWAPAPTTYPIRLRSRPLHCSLFSDFYALIDASRIFRALFIVSELYGMFTQSVIISLSKTNTVLVYIRRQMRYVCYDGLSSRHQTNKMSIYSSTPYSNVNILPHEAHVLMYVLDNFFT